ncbi:hypothetical protein C8F04DRAFT_1277051 [Mycena alexandri]|uniref:CxC2-like cysteine cluster KDZ transposase-associated domain-containing protein n=1 Tax=Mycena alexandri TaxID=1745969 RepID=A0AAD6S089_9AGAR|nr:hypothetical protein C8F04DRAFT_1277051 [Mycena alexandri]
MPVLCIPRFSIPSPFASLSETSLAAIEQGNTRLSHPAAGRALLQMAQSREARSLSEIANDPDIPMEAAVELEQPGSPNNQAPRAEEPRGRHCDFCSTPLDAAARFFRCGDCDSGPTLLCEWEWSHSLGNWVTGNIDTLQLGRRIAVHCGNCCVQLAEPGRGIPIGAVLCRRCDTSVLCRRCDTSVLCRQCCAEAHACMPLHHLQTWTGDEWELTTLRDIGFVYQMGHGGNACETPTIRISSLMVISDQSGNHFLNLRYCNCGKYSVDGETSPGKWLQIRRNSWFASALKHDGVCATFRVLAERRSA